MSSITITVPIKDKEKATEKARIFFASKNVEVIADRFKNDDWEGRYRFTKNPNPKTNTDFPFILEITFFDHPLWAIQPIIEPEIKAFF